MEHLRGGATAATPWARFRLETSIIVVVAIVSLGLLPVLVVPAGASGAPDGVSISPTRSADASHTYDSQLAISCANSTQCMAVGFYGGSGARFDTLAEVWNGTTWSVVPSPDPTPFSQFVAVSCPVPNFCVAVGYYDRGEISPSLVEDWDGSTWSVMTNPNPSPLEDDLQGVSCLSSTQCMAVGYQGYRSGDNSSLVPLFEQWNGTTWSVDPSATPLISDLPFAVSCASGSQCMAVGATGAGDGVLAESWNGTIWTVVPSPTPPDASLPGFNGVSCASPTKCMAVGAYVDTQIQQTVPLTEDWNGSTWSLLTTPIAGSGNTGDQAVSCTSAARCVAVGGYTDRLGASRTLVQVWNGMRWRTNTSPNPTLDSEFGGVSCPTDVTCFAAGQDYVFPSAYTLIEQSYARTWSIVSSPNK
jgi:hypothetical protein